MNKPLLLSLITLMPIIINAQTKTLSGYKVNESAKCAGYPKVNLATAPDQCVGLVASKEDGLRRPRRIIQLDDGDFIITDMYGWIKNRGIVWRYSPKTKSLTKIFTKVDHAHGLALAPDGLVYVGERSKIFRFDPSNPISTREYVVTGLPTEGSHPLTHFIFDEKGDLYVNAGAPSDQCLDSNKRPVYPCLYEDEAAIRKYYRTSDGKYDSNFTVIAQGLRNSMGLAIHPETGDLYQAENNMDFDLDDGPKEEINLIIEGEHYGWPYCYGNQNLNPRYATSSLHHHIPFINCSIYESPVHTLPSHSAPLDILFYQGTMFPQYQGKLLVSLHGYRETGHRIVSLDINKPNSYKEIINNWVAETGKNPKGSPVGMSVAKDGSIWFVEDKNKTIMVLSKGESISFTQDSQNNSTHSIGEESVASYASLNNDFLKNRCQTCHSDFSQSDKTSLESLIAKGWIIPGNAQKSPLLQRVSGSQYGRQMPLMGKKLSESQINELREFINSLK